jgi:F0F1-type ATP synthase membrane subunit b/b'
MPQFDKITFFNQVFWLFVFFSASYVIFLKVFLPKLAQVLKARTKKLSKGSSGVDNFLAEQQDATAYFNNSVEKLMTLVKDDLTEFKNKSSEWVETNKLTLTKNELSQSNSSLEKAIHKQIVLDYKLTNSRTS